MHYVLGIFREEKLYVEASAADPTWSGPWFNLGLLMRKQKRLEEAKHAVDMSIVLKESSAAYYVLQAQIVRDMGKDSDMKESLDIAWKLYPKLSDQNEWELGWYITASEMREDKASADAAQQERSRRKAGVVPSRHEGPGLLPALVA